MHKLQPILRFPEYNEDWLEEKFGVIANNKSSKYNPVNEKIALKCIELEHIEQETGRILGYSDSLHLSSIKNKFKHGDVLFGKLRPYLRKHVLAPFDGVCSSEIWVLTSKIISNNFLYRIVESDGFIDIANQSTGSKMPRADWTIVSEYQIHYPTLPEQTKIATFLSTVDEKLNLLKEKKAALEEYKKGMMQKIFSQEIRFKDENGKDFEVWEEKVLKDFMEERNIQSPKSNEYPLMSFVAYKGVTQKGDRYNREFLVNDEKNKKYKQTEYGDFIYSSNNLDTGSIGLNNFGSASISPVYSIFKINTECDYKFISNYLSRKEFISKMTMFRQGVVYGQLRIHEKDFLQLTEKLPCFAEQTKIALFLSAIDEKIDLVSIQIEETQEYKKGLLQQMFC